MSIEPEHEMRIVTHDDPAKSARAVRDSEDMRRFTMWAQQILHTAYVFHGIAPKNASRTTRVGPITAWTCASHENIAWLMAFTDALVVERAANGLPCEPSRIVQRVLWEHFVSLPDSARISYAAHTPFPQAMLKHDALPRRRIMPNATRDCDRPT